MKAGLLLFTLLLGACVATGRPAQHPLSGRTVHERFEAVAFYSGKWPETAEHPLWRWRTDPVLAIAETGGPLPRRAETYLARVIGDIRETTGLRIRRGGSWRPSLTVVTERGGGMFSSVRKDAEKNMKKACRSSVETDAMGWIRSAVVTIPAGSDNDLRQGCMIRGITRAMGLTGNLATFGDSPLDDEATDAHLGHPERQLLIILYDRSLPVGIGRAEAAPIVDRIVAERGWPSRRRYASLPR